MITTVFTDLPHWVLKFSRWQTAGKPEERLAALADSGYGIVYITEAAAAECGQIIEKFQERLLPAVIRIPGVFGNTGDGVQGVKDSVEQAVGSDILFSNN